MKLMASLLAATICASAAFAQADAGKPASPAEPAPPASGASAKPTGKEALAQCRDEAKTKGLRGPALKADVLECFAKIRPDLAAAGECRRQGKEQGLVDQELRAFVRECMKGKR
jgi:hypothetical protein